MTTGVTTIYLVQQIHSVKMFHLIGNFIPWDHDIPPPPM